MNKKSLILIAIVLTSMLFISGCTQTTAIKNTEEVGRAVNNVSTDVQDVSNTLNDIDRTLGGSG